MTCMRTIEKLNKPFLRPMVEPINLFETIIFMVMSTVAAESQDMGFSLAAVSMEMVSIVSSLLLLNCDSGSGLDVPGLCERKLLV